MAKKAAAPAPKSATTEKTNKVKSATKAELYGKIADKTGLNKKQVSSVFDAYIEFSKHELGKKGPGAVLLPGVGKIKAKRMPATKPTTKANPFKPGEMMTVKAKPASTRIKLVPLKAYKDTL